MAKRRNSPGMCTSGTIAGRSADSLDDGVYVKIAEIIEPWRRNRRHQRSRNKRSPRFNPTLAKLSWDGEKKQKVEEAVVSPFKVGDRVRLSEIGRRVFRKRDHARVGFIIAFSRGSVSARVRWYGNKTQSE